MKDIINRKMYLPEEHDVIGREESIFSSQVTVAVQNGVESTVPVTGRVQLGPGPLQSELVQPSVDQG